MVYLLNMVIFHAYVSHNQMVYLLFDTHTSSWFLCPVGILRYHEFAERSVLWRRAADFVDKLCPMPKRQIHPAARVWGAECCWVVGLLEYRFLVPILPDTDMSGGDFGHQTTNTPEVSSLIGRRTVSGFPSLQSQLMFPRSVNGGKHEAFLKA